MSTTRQTLTYTAVAVGAAAAGFAAGLLLAPASGSDTRRRLGRLVDEKKTTLERKGREVVDRAAEYASDAIEAGREKVDALLHH